MHPLIILLLAFAGLWTGMYWLFETPQEPPVVEPATIDYAYERNFLFKCLRDKNAGWGSLKEVAGNCYTIEIEVVMPPASQLGYTYVAKFYWSETTSPEVVEILNQWAFSPSDLLEALETDELAESRRRKLRLLAA